MLQVILFLTLVYLALGFFTAGCFLEQSIVYKHNLVYLKDLEPIYMAGIIILLWPVFIGLVVVSIACRKIKNLIRTK
jgi:uncharacterized protein YacL